MGGRCLGLSPRRPDKGRRQLFVRMPPTPHPPDTAAHTAKQGWFSLYSLFRSTGRKATMWGHHRTRYSNSGILHIAYIKLTFR